MRSNAWLSGCLYALLLGVSTSVFAAVDDSKPVKEFCDSDGLRGELDIRGRVKEISVAPGGRIWIVTQTGYSYSTDDVLGNWRKGGLDLSDQDDLLSNQNIDRISFFDDEVAIASGYISGQNDSVRDTIYRTEDGGRNWTPVRFPSNEWIYDVFTTNDGKAWMGGSAGSFLYSEDYGASWVLRSSPFKKNDLRTHTIFMSGTEFGIVGSLRNTIKITRDNGDSWHRMPTPVDQGVLETDEDERNPRIEKAAIFGDRMIVEQGNRVFHSAVKPVAWKEFADPKLIEFAVDPAASSFIGVTPDLMIVRIDSKFKSSPVTNQPFYAYPMDIAYVDGRVYAVDVQNGVYQVNDAEFRFSHPLTTEAPREPMRIVRHRDGLLWGVSTDHIYKSNNQGGSWCRVASAHVTIGGFEIRGDGHLLLWDEHGTNLEFDPETNEITPFEPFGEDDVIDIVRQRDLWVAYGGMQYETKRRIEVARTYFSGQFRGSVDRGFVYVSDDSGMTWRRADAWANGGVARVFVGHDREIVLLSYLGSVRKLTKEADGWTGEDLIVASEDTWEEVPYVERAFSFYFPTPTTGFIGGWIHHLGNHYFTTADGGYTWQRIDEVDFPYRLLTPAGDSNFAVNGRELVSLTGTDASTVDIAEVIRQDEVITDISVDGQDRVLIELTKTNDKGRYTRERRWHLVAADEPASDSTR